MDLILRHQRGELGPKTIEEWATPNGDDCLLIWMLKAIRDSGGTHVELVAVEDASTNEVFGEDYFIELRP
jgi:hypothetical protein